MILMTYTNIREVNPKEEKGEEMAYLLSDNARAVLEFLQANPNLDLTKPELAEQTNVPSKSIIGVTNGLKKKGLVEFVEQEFEGEGKVKIVRLTDAGKAFDVDTEKPEKAKAKPAEDVASQF